MSEARKVTRGETTRWSRPIRVIHWGVALGILCEVPAGFAMAWTYAARDAAGVATHLRASQVHHTLGLLILLVVGVRLVVRLRHGSPPVPAGSGQAEAAISRVVQVGLYGLLFLLPLSGWAALSALGAGGGYPAPALWVFAWDGFGPGGLVPHLVPPVPWNAPVLLNYSLFARLHRWGLVLGGVLLALHVVGALKQHFINRNDVLRRMWK